MTAITVVLFILVLVVIGIIAGVGQARTGRLIPPTHYRLRGKWAWVSYVVFAGAFIGLDRLGVPLQTIFLGVLVVMLLYGILELAHMRRE